MIDLWVRNIWFKSQYTAWNLDHRNVSKVITTLLYRWRLYTGVFSIQSISFDFIKNFSFLPFIIMKIVSMHFQVFIWTRMLESWNHFLFCWMFLFFDKKAKKIAKVFMERFINKERQISFPGSDNTFLAVFKIRQMFF